MVKDLSVHHEMVCSLFKALEFAEERAPLELSRDQLDFYLKYGYLKGIRMLTDEQINALQAELTEICRKLQSEVPSAGRGLGGYRPRC